MVEELHIDRLLKEFNGSGFETGERVILGHFGTVQTLLSLILNEPVQVVVIDQLKSKGIFSRQVHIRVKESVICEAVSKIPVLGNRPEVIEDVTNGQLGLGQIIAKHDIKHTRKIKEIGRDNLNFWRTYNITGPVVKMEIREFFYREPFRKIGWLS